MNNTAVKALCHGLVMLLGGIFLPAAFGALLDQTSIRENIENNITNSVATSENIYVANNNSLQQLFNVIGGVLHKPIIVSNEAAKKRVSGSFDLTKPQELLTAVAEKTAVIWYSDGSAIYVYDVSELQSRVVKLNHAPFDRLINYLHSTGLYDPNFPLRSNGRSGSFYVSGTPVYVELVEAAAKYIDSTYSYSDSGASTIRVIKLKNTFVNDRLYTQRDKPITVPGVATVLNQLLNSSTGQHGGSAISNATITMDNDTSRARELASMHQMGGFPLLPPLNAAPDDKQKDRVAANTDSNSDIHIVAYSDTNSLLLQGSEQQVNFVEDLVSVIDVPKQQIQLSLWILDIAKDDINELGIRWQAAAQVGGSGISFNTSTLTPANSLHFLADVAALAQKGNAQVVSRPTLLTQENIPALFDNNTSFYSQLVAERATSLEKVTYGTMISVLPRLAQRSKEIEMILNIQDGGLSQNSDGTNVTVEKLPMVTNTQISTEARVPTGYSLLVGGYSRQQDDHHNRGIPLLKDIPLVGKLFDYSYTSHHNMIRVFLIQPKILLNGQVWQGSEENDPQLGRTYAGDPVTLKATVSMLQQYINKH